MDKQTFYGMIRPYAERVSSQLSIPVSVIMAQWGLESAFGTSEVYKNNNNLAGIKHVSSSIDSGISPSGYAKYRDLDQFSQDYVRAMNNGYYENVKQAASVEDTVKALATSPWAESKYSGGQPLLNIIQNDNLTQYDNGKVNPYNFDMGAITGFYNNMTAEEKQQFAIIGAVAVAMFWFLKN